MKPAEILDHLRLPDTALADQRIPKRLLLEHGTPTAADKRLIEAHVAGLHWNAVLRPDTVAIPAHSDAAHEYSEVHVLTLTTRDLTWPSAKAARLRELVHRAIPYPLLLLEAALEDSAEQTGLSLAHKRRSQATAGEVVLEGEVLPVPLSASPYLSACLPQLALDVRAFAHLRDLYRHWESAAVALLVAPVTGQYHLDPDPTTLRARLHDHDRLTREMGTLRSAATREKALSRRAELNLKIQALTRERAQLEEQMLDWPG
ncbi:DUF4391 domain-containing protein [Deinococcus budaensis]|uniref:DUF4391 domain-containing protein n=1 Tax=Deinococcus budaensis TaxID=1665626 RepID=A0A7W8GI56_9DEIO|nr:DUF4391 domain-containing protein [Deinococcus budaensis]MBB5235591.1 hypothetical protein [Deinococcus budaensis]